MAPKDFIEGEPIVGNYKNWKFIDESYSFDSSLSPKYPGRFTTCFKLDNGLLARVLPADGPFNLRGAWHNTTNQGNLHVIENAFKISKGLQELGDWRINVPTPHGLYLVKSRPFESLHPAFVMEYKYNDFFKLPEDKKSQVLKDRDHMLDAAIENGFIPSDSARSHNNVIYNGHEDRVYLIGFGLWERK
jgi:hypothetical protein